MIVLPQRLSMTADTIRSGAHRAAAKVSIARELHVSQSKPVKQSQLSTA